MADVQPPGGPHAAQNPALLFQPCCHFGSQTVFTEKQISRFARNDNCSSRVQAEPGNGDALKRAPTTLLFFPSAPVVTMRSQSQTVRTLRPEGLSYSSSKSQGGRMLRLIQANFPTTGELHLRNRAPSRFLNL